MDSVFRIVIALAFAGLLWYQARGVTGRPNQRRAYLLAAGALVTVAALNGALAAGSDYGVIQAAAAAVGLALLAAAVAFFVRAFASGEMRQGVRRMGELAREYREQREQELATKTSDEETKDHMTK